MGEISRKSKAQNHHKKQSLTGWDSAAESAVQDLESQNSSRRLDGLENVDATDVSSHQKKTHIEVLHECFEHDELEFFHGQPDKMHSQISRIIRSITTRHHSGGIRAPPPIVSRVFQELSNGVLAYNHACRMKEVPVPFALVHFNAILLFFFNFTAPVVIACYTGHWLMSIIASIVVVSGFSALWLVANELEDPFGYDANDIPMIRYHIDFCAALDSTLKSPWMTKDQWLVKEGPSALIQAAEQAMREQQELRASASRPVPRVSSKGERVGEEKKDSVKSQKDVTLVGNEHV